MWNGCAILPGTIVPLCPERYGTFNISFPPIKLDNPDKSQLQEMGQVFSCTPVRHSKEFRNIFV